MYLTGRTQRPWMGAEAYRRLRKLEALGLKPTYHGSIVQDDWELERLRNEAGAEFAFACLVGGTWETHGDVFHPVDVRLHDGVAVDVKTCRPGGDLIVPGKDRRRRCAYYALMEGWFPSYALVGWFPGGRA